MKQPRLRMSVITVALALASATCLSLAQPKITSGVLTDSKGMTLYVFDNDLTVPGKSACVGACLNMWIPLYAKPGAKVQGDYGLLNRDDGKVQWTYKGRPLYQWYADKKPGDKDGDGLRQAWHIAKP